MGTHAEDDQYAEHFDVGHSPKEHTVHQRIRANSTVMEHKKILGASYPMRAVLCQAGGNVVKGVNC